ncbi:Rv2231c family pyridoxal phosphate-dependent protein CobC [Mycobacterium attenuatum]
MSAPMCSSACRKLATIPCAESVRVPSRSKITSCGDPSEAVVERRAAPQSVGESAAIEPVTHPLSVMRRGAQHRPARRLGIGAAAQRAPQADPTPAGTRLYVGVALWATTGVVTRDPNRAMLGGPGAPDAWVVHRRTSVSLMADLDHSASICLAAARYHGDQAVAPGMLDFAVNVRDTRPPPWLVDVLATRLPDLARYPGAGEVRGAQEAAAARHGRTHDEVLPLAGAAEGFALLPNLRPARAAIIAPAFTEPAVALSAAGIPVDHVVLEPPFGLAGVAVPEAADLVVVGNPTNPTSVLHSREQVLALRRPGRILVVDEAFADAVPGEPESLAGDCLPDVLVLRSLTKTWSLAGLRVGYALGSPDLLARLTARRAHWPVGTLQLAAITACCAPGAVAEAAVDAVRLVGVRAAMVAGLQSVGATVVDGCAPFVLFTMRDAEMIRNNLQHKSIAVRRGDTFVGLDDRYLRAAVRAEWPRLVQAIACGLNGRRR